MLLMPDPTTANVDPFFEETTLFLSCDVLEPGDGKAYDRDPRSIAKRAEAYLKASGLGDTAFFGPEPEFFIFDDVRWGNGMSGSFVKIDEYEAPWNTGKKIEGGNKGHRPTTKGGYFPVPPVDSTQDMRAEMSLILESLGIPVEVFHHEVAGAGQNEIGTKFSTLVQRADWTILQKYVVQNVANAYGKTATFMPKPIVGDNGSGMHVHQSVWKDGKNLFAGDGYAGLSDFALYYIGGIIKHARALNAITNPGTNSYKRLVPGFEAPVKLAYSAKNRSASIRIPYVANPKGRRIEARFPDPLMQPVPGLRRPADGRPGRRREQDPPGRSRHQGPVPPAAGRRREDPDRLPQPRPGPGLPGQGPRVPDQGRRVHRHHDRCLHRAEDGRSHALPHGDAPGRIRHVLLAVSGCRQAAGYPASPVAKGRPRPPLFF
jgi:glutamine synthetase